jgi:hypothetical protein
MIAKKNPLLKGIPAINGILSKDFPSPNKIFGPPFDLSLIFAC